MSEASYNLDDMIGGWFVGDFDPSVVKTDAFEALTDATLTVVKIPSAKNDKYLVD